MKPSKDTAVLNLEIELIWPENVPNAAKLMAILEHYGAKFAQQNLEGKTYVTDKGYLRPGHKTGLATKKGKINLTKQVPSLNFLEQALQGRFLDKILDYYEVRIDLENDQTYHLRTENSQLYVPEVRELYGIREKKKKWLQWQR
jgi:hypothetical protein